jgi:hypothetical protein
MPKRTLRSQLLGRLRRDLRAASELGLAFAVTAGVAACGGKTAGASDAGGTKSDSSAHHGPDATIEGFEAASIEGGIVEGVAEAAQIEGGFFEGSEGAAPEGGFVEAAMVDGGSIEGFEAAMVEGGVTDGVGGFDAGH